MGQEKVLWIRPCDSGGKAKSSTRKIVERNLSVCCIVKGQFFPDASAGQIHSQRHDF